jgi:hypothetical protein
MERNGVGMERSGSKSRYEVVCKGSARQHQLNSDE